MKTLTTFIMVSGNSYILIKYSSEILYIFECNYGLPDTSTQSMMPVDEPQPNNDAFWKWLEMVAYSFGFRYCLQFKPMIEWVFPNILSQFFNSRENEVVERVNKVQENRFVSAIDAYKDYNFKKYEIQACYS